MRYLQHDSHAPRLTSDILNILCGFFTTGVIFELLSHTTWLPVFYSHALSLEVAGQGRRLCFPVLLPAGVSGLLLPTLWAPGQGLQQVHNTSTTSQLLRESEEKVQQEGPCLELVLA